MQQNPIFNSGLTPKLKKRLVIISDYMQKHGVSPTLAELAKKAKCGKAAVQQSVQRLKDKGFITLTPDEHRNICLTDKAVEFLKTMKEETTP